METSLSIATPRREQGDEPTVRDAHGVLSDATPGGDRERFRLKPIPDEQRSQETSRYENPTALGLDVREPSYVAFARHWPTAGGVNGMLAAPSLT
jgi:hypothetical protein